MIVVYLALVAYCENVFCGARHARLELGVPRRALSCCIAVNALVWSSFVGTSTLVCVEAFSDTSGT